MITTSPRESGVHFVCFETVTRASCVEYVKPSLSNRVIKMLVVYKKEPLFCDW